MNEIKFHLQQAKNCNNKTWAILDKKEVDHNDRDDAIRLTNTSYYHWLKVGEPINFQRAEYMLSKVYNRFALHELALHHAERCMEMTKELSLKDFDLAFAYEVMYRAKRGVGAYIESNQFLEKAKAAGQNITDQEDKDIFVNELGRG